MLDMYQGKPYTRHVNVQLTEVIDHTEYTRWVEAERIKSDAFFELVEARRRSEQNALIERRNRVMEDAKRVARQLARN